MKKIIANKHKKPEISECAGCGSRTYLNYTLCAGCEFHNHDYRDASEAQALEDLAEINE